MNKSIKKLFALVALTIMLAPTLHGQDTQTPSTSKLQSAIHYVKNIRTPLTPQEKFAQFIAQADVAGFKTAYDAFTESDATSEERTATLQTLAITAQEVKQTLQTELEKMGNTQVNKTMLTKGVTQTVLGIYSTLATMFSLAYKGEIKFLMFSENKTNLGKMMRKDKTIFFSGKHWDPEFSLMALFSMKLAQHYLTNPIRIPESLSYHLRTKGFQKLAALTNIIVTPLTGYLAYNSLQSGIQNLKNGWNYKAYLEQQIANIDEINEFIQMHITQQ